MQENFNISEGIDGSVSSYDFSIRFSDADCNWFSQTVPVSSYQSGVYMSNYTFENVHNFPCYANSSPVIVEVTASNILGSGLPTSPEIIGKKVLLITTVHVHR